MIDASHRGCGETARGGGGGQVGAWDIDGGSRLGMYDGGGQGGGFRAEPPPIARAAKKMACFGDFKGHFH